MKVILGLITGISALFLLAFVSHSLALLIAHTAIGTVVSLDFLTLIVMGALFSLFMIGLSIYLP